MLQVGPTIDKEKSLINYFYECEILKHLTEISVGISLTYP